MNTSRALQEGLVVAGHGRHVWVETATGQRVICHPRGKKNATVVGDRVQWLPSQDEGTIEAVLPRRNLFYRQDDIRTKSFAANLDQIVILIAAEPEFSDKQLTRALIAAEAQQIKPVIVLNKQDLTTAFTQAWGRLAAYHNMGYTLIPLALKPKTAGGHTPDMGPTVPELDALLQGKTSLILGPSGSGKSTLINRMVPNAQVLTNAISTALNTGKHTTTSTTLYWTDANRHTALIDSPGFQEFGLHHIEAMQLASLMPDIANHSGNCKYYNCSHLHEPACGVIAKVAADAGLDEISERRYKLYGELFAELSETRY
jgi:ribosome biogenesis GTPase / thiamine phosphate phosphatase